MAKENDGKAKIPLIGLLAVKNLLITKEELEKGMAQCVGSDDPVLALKEYLLSNELISSKNMGRLLGAAKALEMRQKEFQFGAIAIRLGFINQSVLKLALEEQNKDIKDKKKVRMIGDLLVDAALLTVKQRDYILKLQKRVRQEVGKVAQAKKAFDPSETVKTAEEKQLVPGQAVPQKTDAQASEKKIQTQNADDDEQDEGGLMEPEIIDGGIKLEIAKDYMSAFITKTDHFDKDITPVQIKEVLFDKGIVMGIVEDKMIDGFIRSGGFKTKSFMVARGISPIQGKDARVEFFFNTDYLKAGGVTDDGSIDFKDRGEIPHVEEGTVLAEKIPMIESRRGHSIFGDEIETTPGNDITLKIGKGARISEDGFKILAAVKGFPKYSLSGHVFVHQEYVSEGDVDYETGHIAYDGNVTIKGRIKAGFKVKGCDVQALEIDGGEIDADGNIKIAGGINEGIIYSRGNVYAKFIHKSQIICMGDVIVDKEIVDSDIECSGICKTENGKLISSRITAKMGVKAKNIGTETAEPNIIKVAYDIFLEKELEKNREQVEGLKKQVEQCQAKKEELKEQNVLQQKQITELAHIQDRSQLEERELKSKIASMEETGEAQAQINEFKLKIDQLKLAAQKAEHGLDICFDKSEKIEALIEQEDKKIEALDQQKDSFIEEKNNLLEWAKDNPGKAEVIVEGAIMPENLIRGKHCEKRIAEVIRHARFLEVLCTSGDGKSLNIYEIQVGSI
ncbi:MAG: FapA family protein [Pseudomonadota bacterium]